MGREIKIGAFKTLKGAKVRYKLHGATFGKRYIETDKPFLVAPGHLYHAELRNDKGEVRNLTVRVPKDIAKKWVSLTIEIEDGKPKIKVT